MDFWTRINDLPTFWGEATGWGAGLNVLILALLAGLRSLTSSFGSLEKRAQRRDGWGFALLLAATFSPILWLALWGGQHAGRFDYVKETAVDYAESRYDLVALSPVTMGTHEQGSAASVTVVSFDAAKPDGDVVHVTVRWLPSDTRVFSEGAKLPKSLNWVDVDIS